MAIIQNSKIADVRESVLYAQARAKLDRECAAAGDENRVALEALADMIGERVRADSDACGKVLAEGKEIGGAYGKMRDVVEKRVNPKAGKLTVGVMDEREALKIALEYYGIADEKPSQSAPVKTSEGVKSIFDFL